MLGMNKTPISTHLDPMLEVSTDLPFLVFYIDGLTVAMVMLLTSASFSVMQRLWASWRQLCYNSSISSLRALSVSSLAPLP